MAREAEIDGFFGKERQGNYLVTLDTDDKNFMNKFVWPITHKKLE